jgi:N-acetylglucosaminyl-diphospho-decaprenol L-rhamnosyltransferase
MTTVLTIILNWRSAVMTIDAAAAAVAAMDGIAGAITIVDNDSGDGSFEAMTNAVAQRGWSRVRVIQSGRNGGFGAGNNCGIRAGLPGGARPDLIYILNSDAFPAPDAIRRLVDHLAANPQAGFAGSYIHGTDGHPHLTSFRFPGVWSEFEGAARIGPISRLLRNKAVPIPIPDQTRPVDWLAGASLMLRTDVLDQIGLFDEAFFLYFEETDLCLRAARAGWRVDYVRGSKVAHIGSASTGMQDWARVPDYWFNSRSYYFTKNHGRAFALAATCAHVKGALLHKLRSAISGKPSGDRPGFLRTLIAHDLRALFRRRPAASIPMLTPDLTKV